MDALLDDYKVPFSAICQPVIPHRMRLAAKIHALFKVGTLRVADDPYIPTPRRKVGGTRYELRAIERRAVKLVRGANPRALRLLCTPRGQGLLGQYHVCRASGVTHGQRLQGFVMGFTSPVQLKWEVGAHNGSEGLGSNDPFSLESTLSDVTEDLSVLHRVCEGDNIRGSIGIPLATGHDLGSTPRVPHVVVTCLHPG